LGRSLPPAILIAAFLLSVTPALAQHLGSRQQWQPQVTVGGYDPDRRLEQTVKLDILGRSAISALAIISQASNLSLYVAPEDLSTVGERKLSIFAFDGIRLKDLMVQIPEALVECHWDIDRSGPEPVYYLHRNSEAALLIASLSEGETQRGVARIQAQRAAQLESVRRALRLSGPELAELEKEDLVLARQLRFSGLRAMLEAFFFLPPEEIAELIKKDIVVIKYEEAPEPLKRAAREFSKYAVNNPPLAAGRSGQPFRYDDAKPEKTWPSSYTATIRYSLHSTFGLEFGLQVGPSGPNPSRQPRGFLATCRPPDLRPVEIGPVRSGDYRDVLGNLLIATGTPDRATADKEIEAARRLGALRLPFHTETSAASEQAEAPLTDADLLRPLTLGKERFQQPAEIQRAVARESRLALIADYFTENAPQLPDADREAAPLWRVLRALCGQSQQWRKAGECLVFQHTRWYSLAQAEVSESVLAEFRKRLEVQGVFTTEDLTDFARATGPRRFLSVPVPSDLWQAGLTYWPFVGCLSREEVAAARQPGGLKLESLTRAQQEQLWETLAELEHSDQRGEGSLVGRFLITESPSGKGDTEVRLRFEIGGAKPQRLAISVSLPRKRDSRTNP
jgi:hypothetical protein